MDSIDAQITTLASMKKPDSEEWLFGRKAIQDQLDGEVSEWRIRKIMEQVRGSGQLEPIRKETIIQNLPDITINLPKRLNNKPAKNFGTETWILAGDFHAPYYHNAACEILYNITEDTNPSRVILLGDVTNLDQFSKYDHVPQSPTKWYEDLATTAYILGNMRQAAPKAQLDWLMGNHEGRLKKYLMRHAALLYDALDLGKLFKIVDPDNKEVDGWNFIQESEIFEEDLNLVIAHGNIVRKHAGSSAKAHVDALLISVIIGHCHRLGVTYRSSGLSRYHNEPPLFGVESGCLCKFDIPYLERKTTDWQHGFTVLDIDRSEIIPFIEPTLVKIVNNKAIFRGKTYKA